MIIIKYFLNIILNASTHKQDNIMPLIVKKFGGSSLNNIQSIKVAAENIKHDILQGKDVIVVVSAMKGMTDHLLSTLKSINANTNRILEEYDSIVSAGEQISAGLMSSTLSSIGIISRSYLGWQIPIHTNNNHGNAKIIKISTTSIRSSLQKKIVPVIAGFQGINPQNNRITTIGRDGSDTTAIALAHSFNAKLCEIYTDVSGVYNTDPNLISNAKIIPNLSYHLTKEMIMAGSVFLQPQAIELAQKHNIKLKILSMYDIEHCTVITNKHHDIQDIITVQNNKIKILPYNLSIKSKLTVKDRYSIFQDINSHKKYIIIYYNDPVELIKYNHQCYENNMICDKLSESSTVITILSHTHDLQYIYSIIKKNKIDIIAIINNTNKILLLIQKKYAKSLVEIIQNTNLHTLLSI